MLLATPKSPFSWDYTVTENGEEITRIDVAWFREAGSFLMRGREYEIRRDPGWGDHVMRTEGVEVARASKKSVFGRSFDVRVGDERYRLRPVSAFRRSFVLESPRGRRGEIRPVSVFSRKAEARLDPGLLPPVQVFLIWLVVVMWRRQANSGGGG